MVKSGKSNDRLKRLLTFIFVICLCFGFSCSKPGNQAFSKENLTPSMYKMLGMLAEYVSRFSVHKVTPRNENLVIYFYPVEKKVAGIFEELIKQYKKELKANFEYSKRTGKQGHIYFYSQKINKIVNSFHMMKGRYATINPEIFSDADIESKLAFLEGVYLRFGCDNANLIRMYNALNKMETIGLVLKLLGCKNIYIYKTEMCMPNAIEIIFDPTEEVKKRLKIDMVKSKDHYETREKYRFYKVIN
jgi:hypothetical protein